MDRRGETVERISPFSSIQVAEELEVRPAKAEQGHVRFAAPGGEQAQVGGVAAARTAAVARQGAGDGSARLRGVVDEGDACGDDHRYFLPSQTPDGLGWKGTPSRVHLSPAITGRACLCRYTGDPGVPGRRQAIRRWCPTYPASAGVTAARIARTRHRDQREAPARNVATIGLVSLAGPYHIASAD
ncbi:MAG TPA: hypothetical protein VK988_02790 [Acidimicrobiales bacterium]|nr:hypothetical protein [Acidimicrobiales bacterium]